MSRKSWAMTIFVVTTLLSAAGIVLVVLAGESFGFNELLLPVVYTFAVVGLLIALRRPGNSVAWICLVFALAFAIESVTWGIYFYGDSHPGTVAQPEIWAAVGDAFVMPGLFLLTTLLLLVFPDGHLPSLRWRWFARATSGLLVAGLIAGVFLPDPGAGWGRQEVENPIGSEVARDLDVVMLVLFLSVVVSATALIGRFRRAEGVERLQLRWLATAGAATVTLWGLAIAAEDILGDGVSLVLTAVGLLLIPIAIGVSVLRYRLFDIDRLISRTVTYALVAGGLAAVYTAIAIGLPRFIDLPEENPVLVAAATLVAAALFNPLRRRIQDRVDRRFNRSRYDAQHEVEEFAERLRTEMKLDDLADGMLEVVGKTVQPSAASVWVRIREDK